MSSAPIKDSSFSSGPAEVTEGPDARDWLAAIIAGSDDAIISKNLKGIIQSWNSGATRLFGYEAGEVIGLPITILIPEDRLDEEPAILAQIQLGKRVEHFETVRLRKDGSLVDISLTISPIRSASGVIVGASKIARDITERKMALEQQQLLIGEMRHRVKNLFALANAIVSISARTSDNKEDLVVAIQARLTSLSRAHALTMSAGQGDEEQCVAFQALIRTILEPYGVRERIAIDGIDPIIGAKAVSNISLLLHELATNAAKYGSLSNADGHLNLNVEDDNDQIRLVWRETGGPPPAPDRTAGFGSRLEKGLVSALGATLERDWKPAGLVASIAIPKTTLEA